MPWASNFFGVVGDGGRSDLELAEAEYAAACTLSLWLKECRPELDEPSDLVVPLFSHVKGGPDTVIELCFALPTVGCLTVPKSHRSSGSSAAAL